VVAGIEPKKGGVLAGRSPALPGAIETKILKFEKKSVSEFLHVLNIKMLLTNAKSL
jgi:hypothetical protein